MIRKDVSVQREYITLSGHIAFIAPIYPIIKSIFLTFIGHNNEQ